MAIAEDADGIVVLRDGIVALGGLEQGVTTEEMAAPVSWAGSD